MADLSVNHDLAKAILATAELRGLTLESYLAELMTKNAPDETRAMLWSEFVASRSSLLRTNQDQLHPITDIIPDYIYSAVQQLDGTSETLWIAGAYEQITGYSLDQIRQLPMGWASILHPDDYPLAQGIAFKIRLGQPFIAQYRIVTASGEIKWLEDQIHPMSLDPESGALTIMGAVHDITVRVRIEQVLLTEKHEQALILRHIADGILFADRRGDILYVNPAWEKITGYRALEAVGKNTRMLNSGQTSPDVFAEMWATVNRGQTWRGIIINRRKNGSTYEMASTVVPVLDEHRRISHFVEVQRDITEERRIQRMRDEFIANASHDLANPVAVMKMSLHLIKADRDTPRQLEMLERQLDRLDALINDLLVINQLERRIFDLQAAPIDLNELLQEVILSQSPLAQSLGLTVIARLKPDLPAVPVDRGLIDRVLVNLLTNALHYTPAGGQVAVETDLEGQSAIVRFHDSGMGIPPEDLPHVFERFFRGSNTTNQKRGTGLGLSIVKEVIDLHRGRIHAASVLGQGTTMTIWLPLTP